MGPPIIGSTGNECAPKTTDNCEAPVELTKCRRWFKQNLMLLVTLSGVLLGVIEGNLIDLVFFSFILNS